ncbi:hypothetical protein KOR42_24040 [Thalassoglobus neptunius]|uniref:Uncharacterized protein n=1 Tax=Thalassoglobus neptunius TaxID=1938619 RepID=A0A5C5X7I9_9PLAN|nr:hypothetical protein [Thalassoglobus neptunius]TWT59016.1 hypothetical protein KOR42_24040 [Thalassoglobus neptunius]
MSVFTDISTCVAQDTVPGAIWTMRFNNVAGPKRVAIGAFRIQYGQMFQSPVDVHMTPQDFDVNQFTRPVGTSVENKKTHKNRFNFKDAVVYKAGKPPSAETQLQFSGVGFSSLVKIGHWRGRFTNSDGVNFEFTCKRIIE